MPAPAFEPAGWVFQFNPRRFDFLGSIGSVPEYRWRIREYKRLIEVGDPVYVWRSGPDAAVVARGEICAPVEFVTKMPPELEFFHNDEELLELKKPQERAVFRVTRVLDPVVGRRDILAVPELARYRVFRGNQGTNFALSIDAVSRLDHLIARFS